MRLFHLACISTTTVEKQRRLNTSTLSTLNKRPDSAEVFKVGGCMWGEPADVLYP